MTEYEKTLRNMMDQRGIEDAKGLYRLLVEHGYGFSYECVRHNLSGSRTKRGRNRKLNSAIARILDLGPLEREHLALANLGLGPPQTHRPGHTRSMAVVKRAGVLGEGAPALLLLSGAGPGGFLFSFPSRPLPLL